MCVCAYSPCIESGGTVVVYMVGFKLDNGNDDKNNDDKNNDGGD